MARLTVGAGEEYSTLAAAIAASQDGDVIKVAAGTYTNDFATITTKITIEGVGGMVHLVATEPPPNGKAILTIDTDATLYNMEFSGAAVPDGNGAGIRYEGGNLAIYNCYFHDNQDGLLSAADPSGSITITDSEFANNGTGDGETHNLYVGEVGTLTVTGSYFHNVNSGHEIKSRALTNVIENNRIGDGPTGTGSYEVDLPSGGNATIQGNVIEKGPNAQNGSFISDGEEGGVYAGSTLTVTGNTVLNDFSGAFSLVHDLSGGAVSITNNQVFGLNPSRYYVGGGTPTISGNTTLATEPAFDTSDPYLPVVPFEFPVCFAEGTRILTGRGEIAVQLIGAGDQVVTLADGQRAVQPVTWVGWRHIDLSTHPRPEMVAPVRIVRGAIADNVPHRDLLLSPDHALYLDGSLIVARQLINGGTIRQDATFRTIRYFHLELDAHAILLAEGVEAESYLDTGNRGFFVNSAAPVILHPNGDAAELRRTLSCAPFHEDEAAVAPVWRRLAMRAASLGFSDAIPAGTTDHGLRLWVGDQPVKPVLVNPGCYGFVLPAGVSEVRLRSRAAQPGDCRPWLADRRSLGVCVARIVLRGPDGVKEVPLDHPDLLEGWWTIEREGEMPRRWTDGDALLRLPRVHAPAVLEIQLAYEMIYPCQNEPAELRRGGLSRQAAGGA